MPVLESAPTKGALLGPSQAAIAQRFVGDVPALPDTTILIVDDQEFTRDVAAAILRRTQATVLTASSVRDGLALFHEHEPDVIICDIAMPQEDGYAFVRAIHALPGPARETPIIALTAYGRPQDRQHALDAGFDAYLKKPVEPIELVDAINRVRRTA